MTQSVFWMHKDAYNAVGGKGFSYFSAPHLLWLAFLFAGIILFALFYRKFPLIRRDNARKAVALFLILSEIFKQCVVGLTGAPVSVHLPLHICSFAEYAILIDAFWPQNRALKPLLCYAFLPSAFMTMLFPTATAYHPLSFYAVHHFLMHSLIVAYIIARYSSGEIRVNYKGVWVTFFAVALLVTPLYFIDKTFNENFAFLMDHGGNPALKFIWDLSGGKGASYILGLSLLVLAVFHITYGIFAASEALRKRILKKSL